MVTVMAAAAGRSGIAPAYLSHSSRSSHSPRSPHSSRSSHSSRSPRSVLSVLSSHSARSVLSSHSARSVVALVALVALIALGALAARRESARHRHVIDSMAPMLRVDSYTQLQVITGLSDMLVEPAISVSASSCRALPSQNKYNTTHLLRATKRACFVLSQLAPLASALHDTCTTHVTCSLKSPLSSSSSLQNKYNKTHLLCCD